MQQYCIKNFACRRPRPRPWGLGPKGQNSTVPEHGHVAYQRKWSRECSNILTHTLDSCGRVRGQNIFFSSERSRVAHQIRREGSIEHHASTYSALTHTLDPLGWVKDQNMLFSESSRVAYQIKWDGA